MELRVCRRSLPRLDRLEDDGSGLLNQSKRFGEGRFIAAVQEDIIRGRGVDVETNGGTDDEGHCFRLGLADDMRRFLAPFPAMEDLVGAFMSECRQMLGGWEIGDERDIAAG